MSLSFFHTYDSIYALVFTFPILKPVFRIIFLQTVFSTFYAIQFPVSLSLLHTHTSILCYLFTFLILKPGVLLCFSNISCKHSHSGSECDSWQRATGFFPLLYGGQHFFPSSGVDNLFYVCTERSSTISAPRAAKPLVTKLQPYLSLSREPE